MNSPDSGNLNENDRLVDPPIVDQLTSFPSRYSIIFVPEDEVSRSEKEMVEVGADTPEGRAISVLLSDAARALRFASAIERVVHGGGGSFILFTKAGEAHDLNDQRFDNRQTHRVIDDLSAIAARAQVAFLIGQNAKSGRASA